MCARVNQTDRQTFAVPAALLALSCGCEMPTKMPTVLCKAKRYDVIKVLGRGAFGTAYLVRRKSDSFLYVS